MSHPAPSGWAKPLQATRNAPPAAAATHACRWSPAVVVLTRNSPPAGVPAALYRRAYTPSPLPSSSALVQLTTNDPSSAHATLGYHCAPATVWFTWNSDPRLAPSAP